MTLRGSSCIPTWWIRKSRLWPVKDMANCTAERDIAMSDLGLIPRPKLLTIHLVFPASRSPVEHRGPKYWSLCHEVVFSDTNNSLLPPHSHISSVTTPRPLGGCPESVDYKIQNAMCR